MSSYTHFSLMSLISLLSNMCEASYCPNTRYHTRDSYLLKSAVAPLAESSFLLSVNYHYAVIVFSTYIFLNIRNCHKFHWSVFQELNFYDGRELGYARHLLDCALLIDTYFHRPLSASFSRFSDPTSLELSNKEDIVSERIGQRIYISLPKPCETRKAV